MTGGNRRTVWIVAACAAAVVLVGFALYGRTMLATVQPAATAASEGSAPRKHDHAQPPEPRAAKLRDDGEAACREGDWRKCENKLNHAQRLDPDGESDPRVKKLRADLARATSSDGSAPAPAPGSMQ